MLSALKIGFRNTEVLWKLSEHEGSLWARTFLNAESFRCVLDGTFCGIDMLCISFYSLRFAPSRNGSRLRSLLSSEVLATVRAVEVLNETQRDRENLLGGSSVCMRMYEGRRPCWLTSRAFAFYKYSVAGVVRKKGKVVAKTVDCLFAALLYINCLGARTDDSLDKLEPFLE